MVGRASLTPGRVLALLGLVVALGGLLQRAPEGGTHWGAIGGAGCSALIGDGLWISSGLCWSTSWPGAWWP
jgi:hypothetical protein